MKLTKEKLKNIIKEELVKALNESLDAGEKKEKAKLKAKKNPSKEDESRLKGLEHQ